MEYDYNGYSYAGQYQELKVTSVYQGEDYGISAIAFDLQEDLLWAATYGVKEDVLHFYGFSICGVSVPPVCVCDHVTSCLYNTPRI